MKNIISAFFFISVTNLFSQITSFYVKPLQTDLNYTAGQDSHLVVRNTTTNLNKLFLFIGGTGSNTKSYATLCNFAGNLGYDVIDISYLNNVAAASLTGSNDSLCFNKYRQEVCYGTPLSIDVTVDSLNSIYTRTIKLINYLALTYPSQNWNQYLINPTTLNWSKIAVGGHSQGGGHACYFGKFNAVERVLMFSSPNDYSAYFLKSANWLRTPGITPIQKHFAYLCLLDEVFDFAKQKINLQGLGLYPLYDSVYVDNKSAPYNNSHFLYTTQAPGLALLYHSSPMKYSLINNAVWTYMLNSTLITGLKNNSENETFVIFPNPSSTQVTACFGTSQNTIQYTISDVSGHLIRSKLLNYQSEKYVIDISDLSQGLYILNMNNKTLKIIKQ